MKRQKRFRRLLGALLRRPRKQRHRHDESGEAARLVDSLSKNVHRDVERIRQAFGEANELVVRTFESEDPEGVRGAVIFINGLVSTTSIAQYVIGPLLTNPPSNETFAAEKEPVNSLKDAISALTYGKCVLLRQGQPAVSFDVRSWAKRGVERAEIEPTELGSMEGFVEDLATNIVLLRRRLRTHKLQTERLEIGKESRTDVRIVYLAGIVREALVEEVRERLEKIDIDVPIDSLVLDEMTADTPWSPFPNAVMTARPDRTAGLLMEGHIAVLVDGTPIALVAPGSLAAMLQAPDDYYTHFYVASFTRVIRWIGGVIGLLASSIYVAIISYNHELIPSRLLFTIASGREGVPFPPIAEAFLMELTFEILREAGLRIPRQIGQALSIVGVLVIGDAAVRAGLVSPLMIVVVGMTAISTFTIPTKTLADSIRLLRFPMILFAGALGLFGVFFGLFLIVAVLVASRSFGVPYTSPFVPIWPRGLRDAMIRTPMWWQLFRPWYLVNPDKVRQQPPGQLPQPEPGKGDGYDGDEE